MNNAKRIIDRFGGQSALANLLGKRQSTVQHWAKTGRIPSHWHKPLMKLAVRLGINLEPKDFVAPERPHIEPPEGRLGVLLVGLGAVSSTFIAGVEHIRRGTGLPIGSITQLATIRLGKRPEGRTPFIRDFVPMAKPNQLVFGAWDPIPDDAYQAAIKAGTLNRHEEIEPIAGFLKSIRPMQAVFSGEYVKRIDGPNTRNSSSLLAAAEAIREDIRRFKEANGCDRLVMVWCASTEKYITEADVHQDIESFIGGLQDNDSSIGAFDGLRICRADGRSPIRKRSSQPDGGYSIVGGVGQDQWSSNLWQGLQDGPNPGQDSNRSNVEGKNARHEGLVLHKYTRESRW